MADDPPIYTHETSKRLKKSNLLEQAQDLYPALKQHDLGYTETPNAPGYASSIEFWPGEETGTNEVPRPEGLKKGQAGVQILNRDKVSAVDVAADIVSHHMVTADKTVAKHYKNFEDSMTDEQKERLQEQYDHAKDHEGEKRSFETWREHSGVPSWFRGYAFQQWAKDRPDAEAQGMYTKDQLDDFDKMLKYLKTEPEK